MLLLIDRNQSFDNTLLESYSFMVNWFVVYVTFPGVAALVLLYIYVLIEPLPFDPVGPV